MTSANTGDLVVHARPHNRRRDHELYFMISKRPVLRLSDADIALYERIDGIKSIAELENSQPGARESLMRWRQIGIIDLIPPPNSQGKPHIVVVEPHMDDAALSVGGRLLLRRGRCRITILSVVRWSNFTSYLTMGRDFLDVEEISHLRLQESALAAKFLAADHQCLEWMDAPLRLWPAERWSPAMAERFQREPQLFTNLVPNQADVSLLAEQLRERLFSLDADEIWIPMGLGNHVDHRMTRSACLEMLAQASERFSNVPVLMYEDLPYAGIQGHADQIRRVFSDSGARLVRFAEDINVVFDEKIQLLSIFASQFKRSYIEPVMRSLAARAGGGAGRLAEVCHKIEGGPCRPKEIELSREFPGLATLQAESRRLLSSSCRRLMVMALPSGNLGDWETAKKSLVKAFPTANLSLCLHEGVAWQMGNCATDDLKIELVKGWRGWLKVIADHLLRFRTPTVVLWRGAYTANPVLMRKKLINLAIRMILPFRRVMFARALADLCCILDDQPKQSRLTVYFRDVRRYTERRPKR